MRQPGKCEFHSPRECFNSAVMSQSQSIDSHPVCPSRTDVDGVGPRRRSGREFYDVCFLAIAESLMAGFVGDSAVACLKATAASSCFPIRSTLSPKLYWTSADFGSAFAAFWKPTIAASIFPSLYSETALSLGAWPGEPQPPSAPSPAEALLPQYWSLPLDFPAYSFRTMRRWE